MEQQSVVVKFESRVFLNRNRYTYLLVGEGERYKHFVTMETGSIELRRAGKESQLVKDLIPYNKYSLRHAADVYLKTTLEKSSKAKRVLQNVIRNKDDSRTDFLLVSEKGRAEKPTRLERLQDKANEITLEQVCKELKLDPKYVRALFRNNNVQKPGNRWTWQKTQKDQIVKLIRKLDSK